MNGRPTVSDVARFDAQLRSDFASRVAAVPDNVGLADMTALELEAVAHLCSFGFPGAWAPKTTKMAALYRPHAVPIMDSHLSLIFDLGQDGFTRVGSKKELPRCTRVRVALAGLREALRQNEAWLARLAQEVADIPGMDATSDLRLLDIVLWTSWDDQRQTRRGERGRQRWNERSPGQLIPLGAMKPVAVEPGGRNRMNTTPS